MSMLITKPMAAYMRLSDEAKRDFRKRETAIKEIFAAKGSAAVVASHARDLGMKPKRLQNLCSEYRSQLKNDPENAWKVCLNARAFPADAAVIGAGKADAAALPPAVLRLLRCWLRGAPTAADAWKKFIRLWDNWRRAGGQPITRPKEFEGWETCPPDTGSGYPAGCSLRNFERLKKKEKIATFESKALQQGLRSVASHLAQVHSSRKDTYVGAIFEFDDAWHDVEVSHGLDIVRPVQFAVGDWHSWDVFHYGLMPRTFDVEAAREGKRVYLRGADFRFFVADTFLNQAGYDAENGTVARMEHGTATLPQDLIELVYDFTGGKLRFELGAMEQKPLFFGQWHGRPGGNPRSKSFIERFHRMLHAASWELPGQTGTNRLVAPEWTHGMKDHDAEIVAFLKDQSERGLPAVAEAYGIQRPFLDFDLHFVPMMREIYDRIGGRRRHEIEGWEECGYVRRVWRLAASGHEWFGDEAFGALNPAQQATLRARAQADPRAHMGKQRLSPREVWLGGKKRLTPIREELACLIVSRDYEDGLKDPKRLERTTEWGACLNADNQIYEARVVTSEGSFEELRTTEKYQVIPFGTRAFIRDLGGRYVGSAALITRVNPLDRQAVEAAMGHKALRNAEKFAPLRADHAEQGQQIATTVETNRKIMRGEPVTREQKAAVKDEAARKNARAARLLAAEMGEPTKL